MLSGSEGEANGDPFVDWPANITSDPNRAKQVEVDIFRYGNGELDIVPLLSVRFRQRALSEHSRACQRQQHDYYGTDQDINHHLGCRILLTNSTMGPDDKVKVIKHCGQGAGR
jgi:hypothetical protein